MGVGSGRQGVAAIDRRGVCLLGNHMPLKGTVPFNLRRMLTVFMTGLTPMLVIYDTTLIENANSRLATIRVAQLLRYTVFMTKVNAYLRLCPV